MLPKAEVIDRRLLDASQVLCAGGDHRHSILIDPGELAWLSDAQVADICLEP
jgi:prolyl-tRNA editing enzyme YbaK/EbsC (Cys-tRNA(Pro) deacylase)